MSTYVFGLDGAPMLCEDGDTFYFEQKQSKIEKRSWEKAKQCVRETCTNDTGLDGIILSFEMAYILMTALDPFIIIESYKKK